MASETKLLRMKRPNKTESPIFVFCMVFISKGNLVDFYLYV